MITLYRGARGKGKTLTLTKDAFKFFLKGFKIYCNLTSLTFGEKITSEDIINLSRSSDFRDCVIVIDEIEIFFDSRNFSRKENKEFGSFLQQIRKRNIHILCTCQYISLVDIRIRQQIDIMAYPHFDKVKMVCKVYYFDLTRLEDDYTQANLSPCLVVYDPVPIFKLYNTYEMMK